MLNLSEGPALSASVISEPIGDQAEIVVFYLDAMGSPIESALIDALLRVHSWMPFLRNMYHYLA